MNPCVYLAIAQVLMGLAVGLAVRKEVQALRGEHVKAWSRFLDELASLRGRLLLMENARLRREMKHTRARIDAADDRDARIKAEAMALADDEAMRVALADEASELDRQRALARGMGRMFGVWPEDSDSDLARRPMPQTGASLLQEHRARIGDSEATHCLGSKCFQGAESLDVCTCQCAGCTAAREAE